MPQLCDSGCEHGKEYCKIYASAVECMQKQKYISAGSVGETPENHGSIVRFCAGNNT